MTNKEVRNVILTICKNSNIEDLDPSDCNVFPDDPWRIGTFFIKDNCLYHGEICGDAKYWPIGKCEDINRVMYRLYEDERTIQFCFEFADMLFVLSHNEYDSCDLELITSEKRIYNEAEVLSILRNRLDSSVL